MGPTANQIRLASEDQYSRCSAAGDEIKLRNMYFLSLYLLLGLLLSSFASCSQDGGAGIDLKYLETDTTAPVVAHLQEASVPNADSLAHIVSQKVKPGDLDFIQARRESMIDILRFLRAASNAVVCHPPGEHAMESKVAQSLESPKMISIAARLMAHIHEFINFGAALEKYENHGNTPRLLQILSQALHAAFGSTNAPAPLELFLTGYATDIDSFSIFAEAILAHGFKHWGPIAEELLIADRKKFVSIFQLLFPAIVLSDLPPTNTYDAFVDVVDHKIGSSFDSINSSEKFTSITTVKYLPQFASEILKSYEQLTVGPNFFIFSKPNLQANHEDCKALDLLKNLFIPKSRVPLIDLLEFPSDRTAFIREIFVFIAKSLERAMLVPPRPFNDFRWVRYLKNTNFISFLPAIFDFKFLNLIHRAGNGSEEHLRALPSKILESPFPSEEIKREILYAIEQYYNIPKNFLLDIELGQEDLIKSSTMALDHVKRAVLTVFKRLIPLLSNFFYRYSLDYIPVNELTPGVIVEVQSFLEFCHRRGSIEWSTVGSKLQASKPACELLRRMGEGFLTLPRMLSPRLFLKMGQWAGDSGMIYVLVYTILFNQSVLQHLLLQDDILSLEEVILLDFRQEALNFSHPDHPNANIDISSLFGDGSDPWKVVRNLCRNIVTSPQLDGKLTLEILKESHEQSELNLF